MLMPPFTANPRTINYHLYIKMYWGAHHETRLVFDVTRFFICLRFFNGEFS
ncbi:hypothetical protein THOE12_70086 [Vibrio rotiferianus]|nr:hypothetical protein THOE12_70086 [Vibrio rotiferianus]